MNSKTTSGGMGCTGLLVAFLTTLFVYLKLTNQLDWTWLWVLSPIWIYASCAGGILLIALIMALIMVLIAALVGD